MRRKDREKKRGNNTVVWVVGGVALAASIGGIGYALVSGASSSNRGYRFVGGGCTVEIIDEGKALAWAKDAGRQSTALVLDNNGLQAWIEEAGKLLSNGGICPLDKIPPTTLSFAYRLCFAYIDGAVAASKMPAEVALKYLASLRDVALLRGVPEKELPIWAAPP